MKTTVLSFILIFLWAGIMAQAPQAFKYQAVARDNSGNILAGKNVNFRISILKGSITGTAVYSEFHSKTTNGFGLVDMEIGKGSSPSGNFNAMNWGSDVFFIKVEMDLNGGTAYQSMGTSQLMSVPYALYATDVQNKNDADADPANELQKISISGTLLTLDKNGGSVTLPSSGTGGDNWGTQVVKTNTTLTGQGTDASPLGVAGSVLNPSWANIQSIPAGFADGTDNVDDADNDLTNEIQALSVSGTVLSLSKGGGSVTLPSSGGGDNWGTQSVVADPTLTGNGTTAIPLKIAQQGAASGQVLKWEGTTWKPSTDNVDDADNSITNEIQTLSVAGSNLSLSKDGGTVAIPGDQWGTQAVVTDASFTGNGTNSTPLKLSQQSATSGQVLKWNGATWSPANDETGGGGFTLPYTGNTSYSGVAFSLTNSSGQAIRGKSTLTTGDGYGIMGESSSSSGYGVFGKSFSGSGLAAGVFGESASTLGYGLFGKASASSGQPFGVYGVALTDGGTGVFGKGGNYGLYGETDSPTGTALYAQAASPSGDTYGVSGYSNSANGIGAGVKGVSASVLGHGVYGKAIASSGQPFGVYGEALTGGGTGVFGKGGNYGLYGETDSPAGTALYAQANSPSGNTCGVYGYSNSATGTGVKGNVNSANGYSGYFTGGKFYISGNTGLGTENPASKLHVLYNSGVFSPHILLDENENDFARLMFRNTAAPSKSWTIAGSASGTDANSRLNFYYHNGTSGSDIVSISGDGKVGIGTSSPQATLNVVGTVQVGAGGTAFSEIKEITGTLPNSGLYTFPYPSGYNQTNLRVLNFEIFVTNRWYGPRTDFVFNYTLYTDYIMISFAPEYNLKNFRMLVMKVN